MKKERRNIVEKFLMNRSEKKKLEKLVELKGMDKSKVIRQLIENELQNEEILKRHSEMLREKFDLKDGYREATDGFGNKYIYQENGRGLLTITICDK